MKQSIRVRLVVAVLVAIVSMGALLAPTQARASSAACDATGEEHCCTCWREQHSYACFSFTFQGVWSCTSEFCSSTPCG